MFLFLQFVRSWSYVLLILRNLRYLIPKIIKVKLPLLKTVYYAYNFMGKSWWAISLNITTNTFNLQTEKYIFKYVYEPPYHTTTNMATKRAK
jgi:hypothetical protein